MGTFTSFGKDRRIIIKIYTAASFGEQMRMRNNRDELFKLGHSVLSTWLNEQVRPGGMNDIQFGIKMAMKDFQEIAECDCLILDLEAPTKTSGKMTELGFAYAKHKLVYIVGPSLGKGGIFTMLADKTFETWEDLLGYLEVNH